MSPPSLRRALVAFLFAVIAGVAVAQPAFDMLSGLSLDILTGLRWHLLGNAHAPQESTAVVVALDEETYRTPPFEGTPNVTWTRELGRVLSAVIDGGASVAGFDIVFPVSIEQSQVPFGAETLGARIRGFDRDWLRSLASAAKQGKVVLGEVQFRDQPIRPSPGQRIAVGQQKNIRPLNAYADPDDIVRRMPFSFEVDGQRTNGMAVELAARVVGRQPKPPDSSVPNTITLNLEGGADDIPTYSLADLRACLEKGDAGFFHRQFAGKVVIFGTLLDVEDRRLTSKRFATGPEAARAPRCALPLPPTTAPVRETLAGVYLHATAVNNLLRGDSVRELGRLGVAAVAIAFAVAGMAFAFRFGPAAAAALWLGAAIAWILASTLVFKSGLALPLLHPVLASLAALAMGIGYRFAIADKDKRLLRQSFALYLAPAVIDRMLASSRLPELGGEARTVTIYFSDVAGFSTLTERMAPAEVVALMNVYLSAMTEIIENEGGFVDKYIGDAIVAVFGAPLDDAEHAAHAVHAALRCQERLAEMNRTVDSFRATPLGQRIGLNSGEVLVGNMGSQRRFNYTVMGDPVNLASRLEGANKFFGTGILASEITREMAGDIAAWREIDSIRVKGRAQPVRVYQPVDPAQAMRQRAAFAAYSAGLQNWRAGAFAEAADLFAAAGDKPGTLFALRARRMANAPLSATWDGVNTLEEK
jgi:class 3 adenylate cyclase/CHASE2 domain-containing sensor protein